jgi:hypothetical protein
VRKKTIHPLYSFLRVHGKYWAVGTEVVHKDQPGGGYGVPVLVLL